MTLPVVSRPQADVDLLEARAWYDAQQPGRGAAFFDAVSTTIRRIAEMPSSFPRVDGETRRAILRRYPYAIYFEIRKDHILVVAIMHNARDPNRWQSRR